MNARGASSKPLSLCVAALWVAWAAAAPLNGTPRTPPRLVSDLEPKTIPTVPKPAYLQSYLDPVFGTRVTRISGDAGSLIPSVPGLPVSARWPRISRHHYSKDQAWSAGERWLMLNRFREPQPADAPRLRALVLDGETYQVRYAYRALPGSDDRWHPTDPNTRVYLGGNEIGTWDVTTGVKTTRRVFPGYARMSFGAGEGNLSRDGRWVAPLATRSSDGRRVTFAYDLRNDAKGEDIDLSALVDIDWVCISPLARYIVVQGGWRTDEPPRERDSDRVKVYTLDGAEVQYWPTYGRPSHFDLTIDEVGDEVGVGISKSAPDSGKLIKRRLRDGVVAILAPEGGSHTSARNFARPGWVYTTNPYRRAGRVFQDEIDAVSLAGGRVERLAHIHTYPVDYDTEAHGVPSPTGTRVLWASDWEESTGRPIGAYVVDLR